MIGQRYASAVVFGIIAVLLVCADADRSNEQMKLARVFKRSGNAGDWMLEVAPGEQQTDSFVIPRHLRSYQLKKKQDSRVEWDDLGWVWSG
ncbi:hypothetical protein M3Y95_00199300 [Aphelenchoides besseyi]|nr:hypothetical protein M3Y95_00199300 [Aphelenchoides besseyi]